MFCWLHMKAPLTHPYNQSAVGLCSRFISSRSNQHNTTQKHTQTAHMFSRSFRTFLIERFHSLSLFLNSCVCVSMCCKGHTKPELGVFLMNKLDHEENMRSMLIDNCFFSTCWFDNKFIVFLFIYFFVLICRKLPVPLNSVVHWYFEYMYS